MKQMASQNKSISLKDMKRAQLTFSFEPGEGNAGKILIFLLIKLFQLIGSAIAYPFTRKKKKEEPEKFSNIVYMDKKDK